MNQPSRNAPCPCGSGKKYKKCCANTQTSSSNTAQNDLVGHAFSLFEQGQLIEAQQVCNSIILTEPRNADALHLLGLVQFQQGFSAEAEKALTSAVKIQSKNAWIQNNLAMVLLNQEKSGNALKHVEKAIKLMPELESAYNILGLIYKKTNQIKSEESFSKAVKLNPNDPSSLCNLGEVFFKNKKYDLANDAFEQAKKITANHIPTLKNLGLLLTETKDYPAALEIFEQLIRLEPNDPDVINNIGIVYMSTGEDERAKEYFEQIIQLHPSYLGAYINLGDLEYSRGNKNESIKYYEQAIKLAPNSAKTCKRLADYYLEKNEFEKSGEYYIQAIENDPNYIEAIKAYLAWFMQQEKWRPLEYYLNKVLPEFPNIAYLHSINARIYMQKELSHDAIKEAQLAVKLEPSNTYSYMTLGAVYKYFGMVEESRKAYQQGINNETDKYQLYFEWANLEERNHNFDKAITLINKAQELEPRIKNEVRLFIARIARRNKELDSAIKELEQVEVDAKEISKFHKDLLFEKGKVFDKMGRYDDAFNCFTKASEIRGKLQNRHFDPENYKNNVKKVIDSLSPATLSNLPVCQGTNSKFKQSPIFIVGFPRSGTTLLEQILCSHPDIKAGGELIYISQIKKNITNDFKDDLDFPEGLLNLNNTDTQNILNKWRNYYLSEVEKRKIIGTDTKENQFTDKMPLNVVNLPLISMLFPDAPIIHIIRNPMDVCLSAFFLDFVLEHYWTNNIEHAAHFYNQTSKLIEHYKKNLPMKYFEVRYEDLIKDQEHWSRKIIEFVGEPWDEQCLQFHKTKRVARTASYEQVTQKIYTSSVARYKNYEKHLSKPLEILKPVMQRYDYI